MKKLLSVICAFAFVSDADAQHFRWKAPVNAVDTSGYVRILLQPEVTGEMREGYPDLRILDEGNGEIPYLVARDRLVQGTTRFVEYPVVDKRDAAGYSYVTVENPLHKTDPLDQICLVVNNTEANREMTLVGSYDNQNWFAIKDEFYTSYYETYVHDSSKTTSVVVFDFPLTDYRYFRFNFDNWHHWWYDYAAPVFVVRAGVMMKTNPASLPDQRMEIGGVKYSSLQIGKTTAVDITFDHPNYIDYMRFNLSSEVAPGTFHRGARLYIADSTHHCDKQTGQVVSSTILSNGALNEFAVNGRKVERLCLHIDNEDDRPLNVDAIHTIQIRQYAVAFLEKGKQYTLYYSDDSIPAPRYDLRYRADDLVLHEMNVTGTGTRIEIPFSAPPPQAIREQPFYENRTFIWLAIAIVILILGWMSVKMLREMKS